MLSLEQQIKYYKKDVAYIDSHGRFIVEKYSVNNEEKCITVNFGNIIIRVPIIGEFNRREEYYIFNTENDGLIAISGDED